MMKSKLKHNNMRYEKIYREGASAGEVVTRIVIKQLGDEFVDMLAVFAAAFALTKTDDEICGKDVMNELCAILEDMSDDPTVLVHYVKEFMKLSDKDKVFNRKNWEDTFGPRDEQLPGIQEKTLKSEAQRLTEKPKPAPKATKRPQVADAKPATAQGRDPKTGRFLKKEV
jgi:hypothetical protein